MQFNIKSIHTLKLIGYELTGDRVLVNIHLAITIHVRQSPINNGKLNPIFDQLCFPHNVIIGNSNY